MIRSVLPSLRRCSFLWRTLHGIMRPIKYSWKKIRCKMGRIGRYGGEPDSIGWNRRKVLVGRQAGRQADRGVRRDLVVGVFLDLTIMCIIRLRLFVRRSDNSIPNGGQKKMNSARDVLGDAAFSLSIEQCAMGGCKCVNIRMGGEDRRRLCAMSDVLLWACRRIRWA